MGAMNPNQAVVLLQSLLQHCKTGTSSLITTLAVVPKHALCCARHQSAPVPRTLYRAAQTFPDIRRPGRAPRCAGPSALAGLALLLCLGVGVSASWADAPDTSEADWGTQRAEVEKRFAQASEKLAALRAAVEPEQTDQTPRALGVPSPAEFWQGLVDIYKAQLDKLRHIQETEISLAAAEQAVASWRAPQGGPPWPLLDGDDTKIALFQIQAETTQLIERLRLLERDLEGERGRRDRSEVHYRLAHEQSLVKGAESNQDAARRLELAKLELDARNETIYLFNLKYLQLSRELRLKAKETQSLEKTLRHFNGEFILSEKELARIEQRIDGEINRLRELETRGMEDMTTAERLIKALRQKQAETASSPAPGVTGRKSEPEDVAQRLAIALAVEERLQSRVELYRDQIATLQLFRAFWAVRAELYSAHKPDHAEMLELEEALETLRLRVEQTRRKHNMIIETNSRLAAELREQMAARSPHQDPATLKARLDSATGQIEDAREGLEDLQRISLTMRIVAEEIDQMYRSGSLRMWLNNARIAAGLWARAVWNFELMTVEDTFKAEGREIRSTRSITVGKSIGAVIILIIGYLATSWLIRVLFAFAVARLGMSEATASLVARWLRLTAISTLILLSFNLVDIPLRIFAFLGGALAIAFGFGAQTLLKNLISGIMLLAERPVRVGDLVEVDGVRGRISTIGIRVSTLCTANGMDMLIPNSALVEQKLINWTHTSQEVRYEINVGVAYGSNVNLVTSLLLDVAERHPEVLVAPEPAVIFDEFGESALQFVLRIWIRMAPGVDPKRIASDLRYRILDDLTKAGVTIPFPERRLHMASGTPLEVRILD